MDLRGGSPLRQQQDIQLQGLWVPGTPVKFNPTRKPLTSTPRYNQINQPYGASWLDAVAASSSGLESSNLHWGHAFQDGVYSSPGVLGGMQDLAVAQAVSGVFPCQATGATDSTLHTQAAGFGNIGSVDCCAPWLSGNGFAALSFAGIDEMRSFPSSSAQIGGEQEMNYSPDMFLLNGQALLNESFSYSSGDNSSWHVQQKFQYESPVTYPPYLNSFQETTSNFDETTTMSNAVTPIIMEKYSKRRQDEELPLEVIEFFHIDEIENFLKGEVSLSKETLDSRNNASISNLIAIPQHSSCQSLDSVNHMFVHEISRELLGNEESVNAAENGAIELNYGSKEKPKRKKHRPKVVIEGKPAVTPKPTTPLAKTPKPAKNKESASTKRKYMHRNGTSHSLETVPEGLGDIVVPESWSGPKSVRRFLNFDIKEQTSGLTSLHENIKNHVHEACDGVSLGCSNLRKTLNCTGELGSVVEHSLSGIVFDIKSSGSQAQSEFLNRLQTQVDINDGELKGNINSTTTDRATPKCTKRGHYDVADACASAKKSLMHSYGAGDYASLSQYAARHGSHLMEPYKTMSIGNVSHETTFNPSPGLGFSSLTDGGNVTTSISAQKLAIADEQKLIAEERMLTTECMLSFEATHGIGYNNYALGNNLTCSSGIMKCKRSSNPAKKSRKMNKNTRQPANHGMPSVYINSQESKLNGIKGKRGRKKREENRGATPLPSSDIIGASPGQINPQITTTTSNLHRKNLLHGAFFLDRHDTSNCKASTYLSFSSGPLVPYIEDVDDIAQKLRQLNLLNKDLEVDNSQEQNALVPYVGNSGMMIPYEGTFVPTKTQRPRAKVDLDPETHRVWKLLMEKEGGEDQEPNLHTEKWWEEERRVFRGRVDSFIARMHLVQGDRRFSRWNGSVVDSVIGVFLTQNVSDHISSSAFMAIAAKYPAKSGGDSRVSNVASRSCTTSLADSTKLQRNILGHGFCCQTSLVANVGENDSKKESSSSDETLVSATRSSSVDNSKVQSMELQEAEVPFGQESPNNGSGMEVSVTRSISPVEVEDKRFIEEVVSSENSVISSQNSMGFQLQLTDHIRSSSLSDVESEDPFYRNVNNDFCRLSSTDLQIAEDNMFHEFYNLSNRTDLKMQCSSTSCQGMQEIRYKVPALNQLSHSNKTNLSCSIDFHQQHVPHSLSNKLPDSQFSERLYHATIMGNNGSAKDEIISILPSNTSDTINCNELEATHRKCSKLVEKLVDSYSHNKIQLDTRIANFSDSNVPIRMQTKQEVPPETDVGSSGQSLDHTSLSEKVEVSSSIEKSVACLQGQSKPRHHQKDSNSISKAGNPLSIAGFQNKMENSIDPKVSTDSNHKTQNKPGMGGTVGSNIKAENNNFRKVSPETPKQGEKVKRRKGGRVKMTYDWDSLRKEVYHGEAAKERSSDAMDSVDWEAVRCANVSEIAETIRERGMNNMLAERIKDFLNRLVREHGSIDLEWLRDISPDKSKDFLLSVRGLGLKSAECVRLLTLHHLAFPVDTNVGRICVRLGWVPLQPLPESLQLHLLEMYPVLETIQKYLWPRLCKLDQRILYELHYQMITFGKVFCTKSKPNCNSCPMRGECKHFASAFASARAALPAPEDKSIVCSTFPISSANGVASDFSPRSVPQLQVCSLSKDPPTHKNCEPIVEEPATPEPECSEILESAIEEAFFEDPDEIPIIKLNFEKHSQHLHSYMQENLELYDGDMSKALVALPPEFASFSLPKLKNVSRLRTEHQVYEIPDSHPLLEGLDRREPDDPCPYLLAIWTLGEAAQSSEPLETCCDSEGRDQLSERSACFSCNSIRENQAHNVRGTLLIPCRTAMRGSFPLNGTYFQVNEVFADHSSSRNPIDVPRDWIWNLPRRTVYFGTSIPTIFRGHTKEEIQQCFWRGFICVRGFDRVTRAPKPLYARLHFPASKAPKPQKSKAAAARVEK